MLYLWIKALHVISVIAWMAGMLYLPRLYVYHASAAPGSEASETFKVMERRLLKAITTPAMIASLIFGIAMLVMTPEWLKQGWLHAKLTCVLGLLAVHGLLARSRREFAEDRNTRSPRYYRVVNEVPTVLMIAIVIFVIVKPF
ncbi:putative membrane protein [Azospirillum fermentarium]|uniref:protoporphyrinogen oxidase HemJ n=1 Tax=Azospirillum fermentarium TaxID=1233114 RepID=UPI002226D3E3|nr:protoporphyrinogen oxidase HemJ [Azospirillum fermentarium]MCW2245068.1 putative membrane protein [Azospirillum fermentarium]